MANRLDELLGRWEDDDLSSAEIDELAGLLEADPTARSEAVNHFLLSAQLREVLRQANGPEPQPVRTSLRPSPLALGVRFSRRWLLRAGLVAAGGLAAVGGSALVRRQVGNLVPSVGEAGTAAAEPHSGGVAILTRSVRAEWEPGAARFGLGSALPPGPVQLRAGLIQLEFFSGATLILQGPARLDLRTTEESRCLFGRLRAWVPPLAHGFRLLSAVTEVVERGTELGLRVTPDEGTEVHVFRGKLGLYEPNGPRPGPPREEMAAGTGSRFAPSGQRVAFAANPNDFTSPAELDRLATAAAENQFRAWLVHSERLRKDPRLVLYYPFQNGRPWERTLSAANPGDAPSGAVIGCEWVTGRWPRKQALEFKRPSDRVRLRLPGTFLALTLMAWVRVDALEQRLSSLMLTDGFELGAPHWQISRSGRLALGVRHGPGRPDYHTFDSPVVFGPEQLGRWVHLATVYNAPGRRIAHYVNGGAVSDDPLPETTALSVGDAEIGNWGAAPSGDRTPVRNFNGRIDEFAVFRAALTADEIAQLHEAGSPEA